MRDRAILASIRERLLSYGLGTILAIASLAISTFVMVVLVNLVASAFELTTSGLRRVGADLLFVTSDAPSMMTRQLPRRLTIADGQAVQRIVPGIRDVGASLAIMAMASSCGHSRLVRLIGVTPIQREIEGWRLSTGRFVSDSDVALRDSMSVLGAKVFDGPECSTRSDTYVRLGSHQFRVVGRLESRGALSGTDLDQVVLIPISTLASKFGRDDMGVDLLIRASPGVSADVLMAQVRRVLRYRHRLQPADPDDVVIRSQNDLLDLAGSVRRAATGVVLSLVGVSLIVAAINVLNSVSARVMERRSEIGLRRAVGATRTVIRLHFLGEALAISVAGALIGPLAGIAVTTAITSLLDLPRVYHWWAVWLSAIPAIVFGTCAGVIPAVIASNQEPIDALRHE